MVIFILQGNCVGRRIKCLRIVYKSLLQSDSLPIYYMFEFLHIRVTFSNPMLGVTGTERK